MPKNEWPVARDHGHVSTGAELKKKAAKRPTLNYKGNLFLATLRKNVAQGRGFPTAAIVLQKPDGTTPRMMIQHSTFRGYSAGKRK